MNSKNKVFKRGVSVALAIATSLSLSAGALVMPLSASAALSQTQVDAIISLLQSFGADTTTINNVRASLTGGTPTGGSSSGSAACAFSVSLQRGSTGAMVTCLQNYLISTGHLAAGNAVGTFGPKTEAAVKAWQTANGVSSVGIFGPASRAKYNMLMGGTGSTPPPSGGTVGGSVSVSAGIQPVSDLIPANAANVPFTRVVFTNNSSGMVRVNSVTVERQGVGSDTALTGVVLLDENGVQVGIARTLNSNHQAVMTDPFDVPAGGSRTITLAGNRAGTSVDVTGQAIRLALVSVDAGSSTVGGSLPIVGPAHQMNTNLTIGSVTMTRGPLDPSSSQTKQVGTTGFVFSSVKVTAGSSEDVYLRSIRWNQASSAAPADLANIKTYVDGTAYNTTVSSDGKYYTSHFGNPGILIAQGLSKEIYVKGDIVSGSGRSIDFDIYKNTDLNIVGKQYGYGITPPTTAGNGFGSGTPWYAGFTTTVSNGNLTVAKAVSVPAQNVVVSSTGQVLGGFDVTVQGEPISVASLKFHFGRSSSLSAGNIGTGGTTDSADLTNVALYAPSGAVVAGPVDISGDTVTFSTTVTFPIGTGTYTLKGKLSSDYANNDTLAATTTPSSDWTSITGQTTGNSVTAAPTSAVTGNTVTVKSVAVTISVAADPVAQTVVAGASQFTFAKYQLDATASGEDVRFASLPLEYTAWSGNSTATNLTNCQLYDGATSVTTGSNVKNPTASASSTVMTFDGTGFVIAKGTVKTLDLKCNIAGGATGKYYWGYDSSSSPSGTGVSTGVSASITENDSPGQVMTLSSGGTLTVTSDSSTPSYKIAAAGTTNVTLGVLKFRAANEAINLVKLKLQLSNSTSSSSPTDLVKVTMWDGATQVGETIFAGTSRYASSTLTGLFVIPKDGDKVLTLKGDLAQVGTSLVGTQGALLQVNYDGNDVNGTVGSGVSSGSNIVSSTTSDTAFAGVRMFKAYPVFTRLTVPSTSLTTQTGAELYRFSVKAVGGSIGLAKLVVNIATSTTPNLTSTTSVSNLKVIAYNDTGCSTPVSGFSTAGQLDTTYGASGFSSGNVTIGGTTGFTGSSGTASESAHLQIPQDATYCFKVLGDITLSGSVSGGSVITKIQGDTAYIPAPIQDTGALVASTTGVLYGVGSNFVWSPNATTTADLRSADWTNGYFVEGLPSTGMDSVSIVK